MELDSSLLSRVSHSGVGLRLYSWSRPWVTLGRSQNPDLVLKPESGVPHVIRPTGGGAVLHGHDVTFALTAATSLFHLKGVNAISVRDVYRLLTSHLLEALTGMGCQAAFADDLGVCPRQPARIGDCFASSSGFDILDAQTGNKLCGCAMSVTKERVLVQGSIPVGPPLIDPFVVLMSAAAPTWIELNRNAVLQQLVSAYTEA